LRRLFRTPVSSLTIPGIIKRKNIVSLQDDALLHWGFPFILAVPFSSLVGSFLALHTSWSQINTRFSSLLYGCSLLGVMIMVSLIAASRLD
jgi:hypothetical protein